MSPSTPITTVHRMPLAFGPFPGPRQTSSGISHRGWQASTHRTSTIVFKTSAKILRSFLPNSSFRLDVPNDIGYASLCITHLENLSWLAGRGYNHYGLYVHDVVCTSAGETVRGRFLVALWENLADPILSGREELGYAKLYAELNENYREESGAYELSASWLGTEFSTLEISGLGADRTGAGSNIIEFQAGEGILHYKFIPKTGRPGEADAQYATFTPTAKEGTTVINRQLIGTNASFTFNSKTWEQLPTLFHILRKLEMMKPLEVVRSSVAWGTGLSDLREHRIVGDFK